MCRFNTYFLVIIFLSCRFLALGQSNNQQITVNSDKIARAVEDAYKRYPQEKLFIHTSQNNYVGGQTVWYKIYAMAYGQPSQLSNIVYLNLATLDGKIITENKEPLVKGAAQGSFVLSDTLSSGWYQLQAYTAWMLNFGLDAVWKQRIYVQNINSKSAPLNAVTSNNYHVTFYPEGGDMIDGTIARVAFKATDKDGAPVSISGNVVANGKQTNITLVTRHDGMGSFNLEAYATTNYQANVRFPDNSTQLLPLPAVNKSGVGLAVTNSGEFLSAALSFNSTVADKNVTVVAMQSNGLSVNYPVHIARGTSIIRFKKTDFATGILRVTVFDENSIPLAERLVFLNNDDQLSISMVKDSLSFSPKGMSAFSFSIKDAEIQPRKTNFSVAITDAALDGNPAENILSALLVSSELKGHVNNPAYYFQNNSDSLQKQLDLVMLTNGWRHFKWERILNSEPQKMKYTPEKKQFAAGFIENYNPKKGLRLKLIVIDPDSSKHFINVYPDSIGRFTIDDSGLAGKAQLFYDAVDNQNKKASVKIKFTGSVIDSLPALPDTIRYAENRNRTMSTAFLDTLQRQQQQIDFSKTVQLKQVTIRSVKKRPVDQVIADHVKNLTPDRVFDLDLVNERSIPTMDLFQYIKGRFPGLDIFESNGLTVFRYRGINTLKETSTPEEPNAINPPYFYLNEARVYSDDVRSMSMNDIALVRFAPPPVWFAPLGGGLTGAILIYTKNSKDDGVGSLPGKGFDRYVINGYTAQREFAEPDYTTPQLLAQPDYRQTLYWNPNATPDKYGYLNIRFYNSDRAKHYRVTVQGMAADGKLGYYSKVF